MKYQQLKKKTEGFTIIEVLIVLAIAGLILLIVFLAVPALQRNQRNNGRNNDASRLSTLVTECLANRNGDYLLCNSNAEIAFNAANFSQIETVSYNNANDASNFGSTTQAIVNFNSKCVDGGGSAKVGGTKREFSVSFVAEPAINRCIGSE